MRRGAWLFVVVSVWLCAPAALAQAAAATSSEPRVLDMRRPADRSVPDPGAFARGAAIYGTVSGALMLGGAIAIAAVDDLESERITRGVWLGTAAFSAPFVALAGWTARKRTKVQGYKGIRWLGWTTWVFAITNGTLQLYEAFHDDSQHAGITIGLGVLGALSVLPMSFDAYVSGRRATMRGRFMFGLSPSGATLRF